jgi:hypothetical protein
VRSRGLELDVSGQLTDQWSLIGSYAYTDAEVTKDPTYKGMRLQNVAKNSGSLSAVYDFGTVVGGDKLRVGAGARYVGERAGDALNDFDLPGYTVADAFATYDTRVEGQKVKFHSTSKTCSTAPTTPRQQAAPLSPWAMRGKSRWPARWSFEASGPERRAVFARRRAQGLPEPVGEVTGAGKTAGQCNLAQCQ